MAATATAILPECYGTTGIPPIALDPDTVFNTDTYGNLIIDVGEQDVKPQSNKGFASWFNLSGDNNVPSVRINTPLQSAHDSVYLLPGTKATLTDFITEGQTIVMPIVADIVTKGWEPIDGVGGVQSYALRRATPCMGILWTNILIPMSSQLSETQCFQALLRARQN